MHSEFFHLFKVLAFLVELDSPPCTVVHRLIRVPENNMVVFLRTIWLFHFYGSRLYVSKKILILRDKILNSPPCMVVHEEYRRLARHSPRAEANIAKACNTMQWSHKIS